MAIINDYVQTEKFVHARHSGGATKNESIINFENEDSDDDGSVYGLMKISREAVIRNILLANQALTGGTDFDIGLYKVNDLDGTPGAVVDKDIFANGLDLSAAHIRGSELSGIKDLPVPDSHKTVFEILGLERDEADEFYYICLTANIVGTAKGWISTFVSFL